MLDVNICKVLLDIFKDQPTAEKAADSLNHEECELKALIQGNGLVYFSHVFSQFARLCNSTLLSADVISTFL